MKQPEPFTFFLDRSLGKHTVANALRTSGFEVLVHDDHFAQNATDEQWLGEVGKKGWIVLTKDKRFHNRVLEITAIARSHARVFKLTAGSLQGLEMADVFVKAMPKIRNLLLSTRAPFIATVSRSGKVTIAFSARKLAKYK